MKDTAKLATSHNTTDVTKLSSDALKTINLFLIMRDPYRVFFTLGLPSKVKVWTFKAQCKKHPVSPDDCSHQATKLAWIVSACCDQYQFISKFDPMASLVADLFRTWYVMSLNCILSPSLNDLSRIFVGMSWAKGSCNICISSLHADSKCSSDGNLGTG